MNLGDTYTIQLNYTVNGISLYEFEPDDIEFCFGGLRFTLGDGTITLNDELKQYEIFINQEQSFSLPEWTAYQLRVIKGGIVSSNCIGSIHIGNTISREVI